MGDLPDYSQAVATDTTTAVSTLLSLTGSIPITSAGTLVWQGDVSTYNGLIVIAPAPGPPWDLSVIWNDTPGQLGNSVEEDFYVAPGQSLNWYLPVKGIGCQIYASGSNGGSLTGVSVVGVRGDGRSARDNLFSLLAQGYDVLVASGASTLADLLPWSGPAVLTVATVSGSPFTVKLLAQTAASVDVAVVGGAIMPANSVLVQQLSLPPYWIHMIITNTNASSGDSFHYAVVGM
jgi:hypothetical protein